MDFKIKKAKEDAIDSFGKSIWDCNKCNFDEFRDVRYCGGIGEDTRVFFIAESPSTAGGTGKKSASEGFYWGPNPNNAVKLFHEFRAEYGLVNCYTTDLVKCGVASGKPTNNNIHNCLQYIKKEMENCRPNVVVAVGKSIRINGKVYAFPNLLKELLNLTIPIVATWHYSYVWRWCRIKNNNIGESFVQQIKPDKMAEYRKQHENIFKYI